MTRPIVTAITATAFLGSLVPLPTPPPVPQGQPYDLVLTAHDTFVSPMIDVDLTGVFSGPGGQELVLPGFWDGDRTFRIRFTPTVSGRWTYSTVSGDPGLDARMGVIEAAAPSRVPSDSREQGFRPHAGRSPPASRTAPRFSAQPSSAPTCRGSVCSTPRWPMQNARECSSTMRLFARDATSDDRRPPCARRDRVPGGALRRVPERRLVRGRPRGADGRWVPRGAARLHPHPGSVFCGRAVAPAGVGLLRRGRGHP